jgi:hypothetical protein
VTTTESSRRSSVALLGMISTSVPSPSGARGSRPAGERAGGDRDEEGTTVHGRASGAVDEPVSPADSCRSAPNSSFVSAYTAVSAGFARDGTPVFGFETSPAFAEEPVEFEFVVTEEPVRFALRTGDRLVAVAGEEGAKRLCRRLVEYEAYDVGVKYVGAGVAPDHLAGGEERAFDEVTRHHLTGEAYERLYGRYVE